MTGLSGSHVSHGRQGTWHCGVSWGEGGNSNVGGEGDKVEGGVKMRGENERVASGSP